MDYQIIINNLQYITTSRLYSISRLYNCDCNTSNVLKLYKALKSIKKEDRVVVRVTVDVSFDEVLDMLDALQNGIDAYKKKYKVRTFPISLNIYQLVEALNKIDAKQLVKEIIIESATKPKKKSEKKVEDVKPLSMLEKRRIILMNKNL